MSILNSFCEIIVCSLFFWNFAGDQVQFLFGLQIKMVFQWNVSPENKWHLNLNNVLFIQLCLILCSSLKQRKLSEHFALFYVWMLLHSVALLIVILTEDFQNISMSSPCQKEVQLEHVGGKFLKSKFADFCKLWNSYFLMSNVMHLCPSSSVTGVQISHKVTVGSYSCIDFQVHDLYGQWGKHHWNLLSTCLSRGSLIHH